MLQPALGVGALLLADHRHRLAAKAGEAADDRRVLAVLAVAGERREVGEQRLRIVEAMRPVGMARNLNFLPWSQGLVDFAQGFLHALLEPGDLVGDVDRLAAFGKLLQLKDFSFEVLNRLFEIEVIVHA